LQRAEALTAHAYGAGAPAALDAIRADAPDLLAAFERSRHVAPARAARIAIAVSDAAIVRGAVDLRGATFSDARDAADASGDDRLRAQARLALGRALLELGRGPEAASVLTEAVVVADGSGDADAVADARRSLAWAELALGRAAEAEALIDHALSTYAARPNARAQADALAVRGLARCLRGSSPEGMTDLEAAHAIHVVCDDRIRRVKVAEMARFVGLGIDDPDAAADPATEAARLRASAASNHTAGRLWREAIDLFGLACLEGNAAASAGANAMRESHLARALAAATAGGIGPGVITALSAAATAREEGRQTRGWIVGEGCRWVEPPGGDRLDLARHGSLRLVLDALVSRRIAEPGVAMSAAALLERGWPGERVRYESGMLRVYTAIRRLRALGLTEALETRDDGYLLSVRVPFERHEA
jgi:tetratricopeptide (TPR) repeat protein